MTKMIQVHPDRWMQLKEKIATLIHERDEALRVVNAKQERIERLHDILDDRGVVSGTIEDRILTLIHERDEARAMLEQARADAERLREALRLAEGPIAIAASYADQPCETMGIKVHAKDCARVLPEIHAALVGEKEAKCCTWTYDETHCTWDSSCGEKWVLMYDGPNENKICFCHGCGKPVEIACEATSEKTRQT